MDLEDLKVFSNQLIVGTIDCIENSSVEPLVVEKEVAVFSSCVAKEMTTNRCVP